MPRPLKVIATTDPLGQKFNEVMAAQGIPGNYRRLADIFGVTPASAREWIQFGRLAKDRYPKLVEWSGRSLHWWFDVPEPLRVAEPATTTYRLSTPAWPFHDVTAAQYGQLDREAQAEAEAFIKGLIAGTRRKREAA